MTVTWDMLDQMATQLLQRVEERKRDLAQERRRHQTLQRLARAGQAGGDLRSDPRMRWLWRAYMVESDPRLKALFQRPRARKVWARICAQQPTPTYGAALTDLEEQVGRDAPGAPDPGLRGTRGR